MSSAQETWDRCVETCLISGRTFRQAQAMFYFAARYWPPDNLMNMPVLASDWFRRVRDVPLDSLRQPTVQPEMIA